LICQKAPDHPSERDEPFFTLSVEIKGKKDLHQALEAYVQGEIIDGCAIPSKNIYEWRRARAEC
jgi:hypothetical protein